MPKEFKAGLDPSENPWARLLNLKSEIKGYMNSLKQKQEWGEVSNEEFEAQKESLEQLKGFLGEKLSEVKLKWLRMAAGELERAYPEITADVYEKNGFLATGHFETRPRDGAREIRMERSI